jgi:hypothetical protein
MVKFDLRLTSLKESTLSSSFLSVLSTIGRWVDSHLTDTFIS